MVAYNAAAQVCHLDTTEVMLFADQPRRSLGGAAAYGLAIDPGGLTTLNTAALAQPPLVSCVEHKGPAERYAILTLAAQCALIAKFHYTDPTRTRH